MHSGFISLGARRALHAQAMAAGLEADRRDPHPDAALLAASRSFGRIERRKLTLLKANEREDDLVLDLALGRLCIEQEAHLHRMCEERATTMGGHRARALAYACWDAGDLDYRVSVGGSTEDLILQAVIRDLTHGGGRP